MFGYVCHGMNQWNLGAKRARSTCSYSIQRDWCDVYEHSKDPFTYITKLLVFNLLFELLILMTVLHVTESTVLLLLNDTGYYILLCDCTKRHSD